MKVNEGRYVEEMRSVNLASLEALSSTKRSAARNTGSSVRSQRRDVLKAIVKDKCFLGDSYIVEHIVC